MPTPYMVFPHLLNQEAHLLETRAHHEAQKVLLLLLPQGQDLPESARANEQKTCRSDLGFWNPGLTRVWLQGPQVPCAGGL